MSTYRNFRQQTLRALALCAACTSLAASSLSYAEENQESGKRRGPPPEAIEACASLSAGEACAFTGRRGDLSGICFAPREELALACAPEGGRRHGRREESEESQPTEG